MSAYSSLRTRFAISFIVVGLIVVLGLAAAVTQINRYQEAELIDQIVSDEMEELIAGYQQTAPAIPGPGNLRRYSLGNQSAPEGLRKWFRASWLTQSYVIRSDEERAELPVELAELAPGWHTLDSGGEGFRVEIRELGSARFYLVYALTFHRERLNAFYRAIALAALLTVVAVALVGLWLSRQITGPVADLARRVDRLRSGGAAAPLAGHYGEREVADLAAAFDAFQSRMERLLERERTFTADVSHELRTPLTSIQTSCELLLGDAALPPKARARTEQIARAVARLGELVNAFLMLAREQAAGMRDRVDLHDCVDDALEVVRERAAGKGLSLTAAVAADERLELPAQALHVVLTNLLLNAVSYTEHGSIDVRADASGVEIADTGGGIPAERVDELFARFRRGDTARGDGYGLGLAIVKRVCDQAGWSILLTKIPNSGTKVRVDFSNRAVN